MELKNTQFEYGIEKSRNLEQNVTDLEENVIIKEEIIIPDALESDQQSKELTKADEKFDNKTMNWLNTKSILKSKIYKYRDEQELMSITNVTNNQLIIQRKSENNFDMIVGIVDTKTSLSEGIVEHVLSENKSDPDFFNNVKNLSEVVDKIEDLEFESVLNKFSIHHEKGIVEQISGVEIENECLKNLKKVLETFRRKNHPKLNLSINGFLRIIKNIAKLQQEKMMNVAVNNLKQTHENINHISFSKGNNGNNNNNNSLNIKIENVVSQAKSFKKNKEMDNPSVTEKIKATNLGSQVKSILKPKIHILDTKYNKIIITQSKSSGSNKLFTARKIKTPSKVIEQMKSKCMLFCSNCPIYQKIGWEGAPKKCTECFKEMKFICCECKETFSSFVQFYAHDMCSCKMKIESGHYWKCNDCNYLVLKRTYCHENFCKKHPSLKCKYCSSVIIHLSEFTKYSIKTNSIKIAEENAVTGIGTDEDNLGNELKCTPLSSMPGQKLNSEKNFVMMCPAGCTHSVQKNSAGRVLCHVCGLVMQYKCLNCRAVLKTYKAIPRHCSWCCSSIRTYYCASCDVFSQQRYYGATPLVPTASAVHRCRNCLARFDSRGKLNVHRRSCDESPWLQCGLCPLKLKTPKALRPHLEEVHRDHANVAQRARVFKFAVWAWRRSIDLFKWKAKKISEIEKNRLKDQKVPVVSLKRLPDHLVEILTDKQESWTREAKTDVEDTLSHECISITFDEVDDQSMIDRQIFFNNQETAYLNNINSLLVIPDSDEEATTTCNNLSCERNENTAIPLKTEEHISQNKTSSLTDKLSKHKVLVERSTSHARRRRIRERRSEPLRCEHCGYLTNAKKELVEHIMSRHAARLFRGIGFDCPRCSCVFNNYHIYERHLQTRHRLHQ